MKYIELYPCYPKGQTIEEQLEKIKEEYNEVLEADNWEDRAKELLDLAQTIMSYMDVLVTTGESEKFVFHRNLKFCEYNLKENYQYFLTRIERIKEEYMHIVVSLHVVGNILDMFYDLICEHDRGCQKYRSELLNRFLQEHNDKLESRKKEWANAAIK
ncbi:nucleoside triphosphate pyrophosphohydrolase family protein [Orenia marismortui]|uniref:hypothetical protein n=1 Tax=Orenia marismortui TaxID=46469 RepID=UPI000365E53C|nr:hypothetical protein [Orenia marismortui]